MALGHRALRTRWDGPVVSTVVEQAAPPAGVAEPTRRPSRRGAVLLAGLVVLGLLTALLSLLRTDVTDLGAYGLLPALPLTWYLGLALLVTAAAAASLQKAVPGWLSGSCVL